MSRSRKRSKHNDQGMDADLHASEIDQGSAMSHGLPVRKGETGVAFRLLVFLFFLTSGAIGLTMEVVWARMLGVVFGNTVYAASTVLTAFMLGLALGSAFFGRLADRMSRPLVVYGALEVGIGVLAFLFPLLSDMSVGVYAWVFRTLGHDSGWLDTIRFGMSVMLLLPPTVLMGGTLPVLSRYLGAGRAMPSREVGFLYGVNTTGAVLGCFTTGFFWLKWLGVSGTLNAAGVVAIALGVIAIGLGMREDSLPREDVNAAPASPPDGEGAALSMMDSDDGTVQGRRTYRLVMIAFAATGFCSMAYEVLWTKVLTFILSTSVYAFTTMLTTFLLGLALGSFIASKWILPRLKRPVFWFGVIELAVAVSVLFSVYLLANLNTIDYWMGKNVFQSTASRSALLRFVDCFIIFLVPTVLIGLAFPIVTRACVHQVGLLGRRVGRLYAVNTLGCVLGSFTAGFILLPLLGSFNSLIFVVGFNVLVGCLLVWHGVGASRSIRWAGGLFIGASTLILTAWAPSTAFNKTYNAFHNPSELKFVKEHPSGIVTVHDLPSGDRMIAVSGINVAGRDFMLRTTQKLQGYIPLLLHPNPQKVAQIGFGSGETTRVGLEFGVPDYTIVEICPVVFEAGSFFEDMNNGSYKDPRLRKVIMDGKNFALLTNEKFDIIMNDSIFPGSSGSSSLYTVDHFRNCRERLREGGLFSCWVPLDMRASEMQMILKSFQSVFPHTSMWVASNCVNKQGLILGTLTPLEIDFKRVKSVLSLPEVAADLKPVGLDTIYDFLDCHICDEHTIREMTKDSPVNTDDLPLLEYSCAVPMTWEQATGQVLGMFVQGHAPVTPYVTNWEDEARDRAELNIRHQATVQIFMGQVGQLAGDAMLRRSQFDQALRTNPDEIHVAYCNEEIERELQELKRADIQQPDNALLKLRLANRLMMVGEFEEGIRQFERVIDLGVVMGSRDYVTLSQAYRITGNADRAIQALQLCLEVCEETPRVHMLLFQQYAERNEKDAASRHIDRAVEMSPDDPYLRKYQTDFRKKLNQEGAQTQGSLAP